MGYTHIFIMTFRRGEIIVGGWIELHILDLCRVFLRHLAYRYPAVGFYVKNSSVLHCKIASFLLPLTFK